MTAFSFTKATKRQARLRMALIGPSGSGKTYSALAIASAMAPSGKIAVIDTERGSASKYAGLFTFDVLELDTFAPETYASAIEAADAAGYDVLIIDSLSHAWFGKDGALEQVDRAAKRSSSQNSFAAWREVTPHHNAMIDAILQCKAHVIVTMRAKTEYVMETNEKGKSVPRKVGLAPVQRDGLEYEFDVVADMNLDNDLIVSKSRCPAMSGQVVNKPGENVAKILMAWLTDGAPQPKPEPMTLEKAIALKNSHGIAYGDMDNEMLCKIASQPSTPADRRQAAKLILAYRGENNEVELDPTDEDE